MVDTFYVIGNAISRFELETDFSCNDFDYVVELQQGTRNCFGSTVPRNTAPIGKGLSPFQKRISPEWFKTAPGYYYTDKYTSALYPITHKIRSKYGVGPLASKDSRFKDKTTMRTPSPGRYTVLPEKQYVKKDSPAPFGVKSAQQKKITNKIPGPATYDIRKIKKCRRTRFMQNFGRPTMIQTVETRCIPVPSHTCEKCEALCDGDYWHIDYAKFLCHLCWEEEKILHELYTLKELQEYKKLRNCSYMHSHEGTDAAIRILPPNKIKKKLRLENYLALYIDC